MMAEFYNHPMPFIPQVYGTRLVAGDTIEEGDVYACPTTGKWEKATRPMIGHILTVEAVSFWVRPRRFDE